MRILMPCMQCAQEIDGTFNPLVAFSLYPQHVEINDSGLYTVTCRNGHTRSTISQQHKHVTLFELAISAILDGYYREAVTSFAASLERFYEYVVKIALHEQECDENLIESTWKEITKQSERQLGAFIVLYTSIFKTKPRLLRQPSIQFRNDIVHKGKVPTRVEAVNFGQEVLEIIHSAMTELRSSYPEAETRATLRRVSLLHNTAPRPNNQPIATMLSPSLLDQPQQQKSVEQYLVEQEFWHTKSLIHRYLESPKCDLENDLLVAKAVASIPPNSVG